MYNYNPYYPQFGQQNSIYPQNQFIQSQQNPGMEVVPVPTIQQVEQVGLQPGQRKMVMVQNEPVIAARYADNMGLVTTEYYRLEKFIPGAPVAHQTGDYVTRQEFNAFMGAVTRPSGPQATQPLRKQVRQGALHQNAKLLH